MVDLLRRADLGCAMYPVMITGGTAEHSEGGYYHVPKRDLIVGLEVLLERKALRIAAELELAETLVKELTEMRGKGDAGRLRAVRGVGGRGHTTTWCWRWRWGTGGRGT